MKYPFVIFAFILITFLQCSPGESNKQSANNLSKQLPRVLFLTTGNSENNVELAQGVVIAIQSFNRRGIPVRLETRDVLYDYQKMKDYGILILSTFPGYHDADRRYSLSYMNDKELQNLELFVKNGGVLIAGDNVGRNFTDGTDRIVQYRELKTNNWKLSACFGTTLSERNMTGYDITGSLGKDNKWFTHAESLTPENAEKWTLVPDSIISENVKVLGYWKSKSDSTPAIIQNKYYKGSTYLLASSGFLHPANDGGYWGEKQIERFYDLVIDEYNKLNKVNFAMNPWPNGHDYAFCATFNAQGSIDEYRRVFKALKNEQIVPAVFVNGLVSGDVKRYLESSNFLLESSGFAYRNYQTLGYAESVDDILLNENNWNTAFNGFRFPYTKPGFWGMLALDENNYAFESSIGANNLEFIHGSVFPYNIVVAGNGYFKTTDILEIAPTYNDDYYFLKDIYADNNLNQDDLYNKSLIYSRYLENYWEYAVKPYNGAMVYLGHPSYVGYNDTTLNSLRNLIGKIKQDNVWITTIRELAAYRKGFSNLRFYYKTGADELRIEIKADEGVLLKNFTINFSKKITTANVNKGNIEIKDYDGNARLIFDVFDGQSLTVIY